MGSFDDALRDLEAALHQLGLRWYVFGAQAANFYGTPRTTADIDVTIEVPAQVGELVHQLQRSGFAIQVEEPTAFAELSSVLPTVHEASAVPVDIVIGRSGLEAQFLARAHLVQLTERALVPVISPEDLIVSKILAGRPKDLTDAAGVYSAQQDLDVGQIRSLLEQLEEALGVSDLTRVLDGWKR